MRGSFFIKLSPDATFITPVVVEVCGSLVSRGFKKQAAKDTTVFLVRTTTASSEKDRVLNRRSKEVAMQRGSLFSIFFCGPNDSSNP